MYSPLYQSYWIKRDLQIPIFTFDLLEELVGFSDLGFWDPFSSVYVIFESCLVCADGDAAHHVPYSGCNLVGIFSIEYIDVDD